MVIESFEGDWECERCGAFFDDEDEAEIHEEDCMAEDDED